MIQIPHIEGQRFAVLGLGKSGMSVARSLKASGAVPCLWDDSEASRQEAEREGFQVLDLRSADLSSFTRLVLSPGIPHTYPAPHPVVTRFRQAGIPVTGDIQLLFEARPHASFVGITGTNGKSTTTALIGHVLKESGHATQIGGNLGIPALSLDQLEVGGIYVLELSSYQLELIQTNKLDIAVLLNITPDHIDRHKDLAGYMDAKARIFATDTPLALVIGSDQAETRSLMGRARKRPNVKIIEVSVERAVTHGVMVAGQQMFHYTGEEEGGLVGNLGAFPALLGKHNWQNACAAFAACRALGVPAKEIIRHMKTFPGLAHRQQVIATRAGVRFVNDSKATNADAASKALACFQDIYWVLGGRPKEGGLSGLEIFAPRIRHAFLIGEAAHAFAAWCDANGIPATLSKTLDVATKEAALCAWKEKKKDAVVLLSPACASWDQFKSFEERGAVFTAIANGLVPPAEADPRGDALSTTDARAIR